MVKKKSTAASEFGKAMGIWQEVDETKNTFIKPEDLAVGHTYAFSYNPKDQPDTTHTDGFDTWWHDQSSFLHKLSTCRVRLFCEVSQVGRFHFHGFIKVKTPLFYIQDVPKLISHSSCAMVKIDDYSEWYMYCLKNQLYMQQYVRSELFGMLSESQPDPDYWVLINSGL